MTEHSTVSTYVNIVFASDEEYLPVTAVALTSAAINFSSDQRLRAFLLIEKPLSSDASKRFSALSEKFNFDFQPIIISASEFSSVRTTRGISVATYFRLFMHLVLPEDVQKVVYLDSDIIITGNLARLYSDTQLNDNLFAGAEDYNSISHRAAYGVPDKAVNINAGVMVCNIKAMRSMDFLGIVQEYIVKNKYRIFHGDQQILNRLFHDRMQYLHIRWNMHGQLFEPAWVRANMKSRAFMSLDSISEGARRPSVIHYNGGMKPWNGGAHPKRREWYKYAKQSTYSELFAEPKWPKNVKKERQTWLDRFYKKVWLDKLWQALREGYRAHETRVTVDQSIKKGGIWKDKPFNELRVLSEKATIIQIHQYLAMRSLTRRHQDFSAAKYIRELSEGLKIYSNAPGDDLDGGFHENVKQIFRSAHIGMKVLPYEAEFSLVLHMAVRTPGFWDALLTSSFDRDLLFGEAAFFGAYAGYFDKDAPPVTRRPFGYILDDLGYYYDARQPSRLETKLNDPGYALSEKDIDRCRRLIKRVVSERLTKYNRYAACGTPVNLEAGSVVLIDQTPHDASIKFGSAERRTIIDMVNAAVSENPDVPIYFKRHPDNIQKTRNTLQTTSRVRYLADTADITQVLDQAAKVYVVSSQVGFEALLRGKEVVTFGMPFYAGWGLTDDRQPFQRRKQKRTIEDIFYAACIDLSIYFNPLTDEIVEIEEAFDVIGKLRRLEMSEQLTMQVHPPVKPIAAE
jgi:Capsule polysaccharide export protein